MGGWEDLCDISHRHKNSPTVLWDAFSSEAKPVLKSISRKFPN